MIRPALVRDIPALVQLENRSFATDRLSRRSFRHLLTRGNAVLLVDEQEQLRGYILVLFNAGTSMARFYSIAVAAEYKGQGVGAGLVAAAEAAALEKGAITTRLEIRRDNEASQRLFTRLGYRLFGHYPDYYEDHMEALRYEKRLIRGRADLARVPYYQQTLEFTCGPASLMMAMHAVDHRVPLDRKLELRLWREATTIFMTAGHGGCGPYGLAVAAHKLGFGVEVWVSDERVLLVDSVRSEEKKEVMRLVQEDFLDEANQLGIPIHYQPLALEVMQQRFEQGAIPVVLISSYRIYQEKFPHWVVVTGFDERFIYVHDPYIDVEQGKTQVDTMNMPIRKSEFARMARYGKANLRAAILISPRERE
jgi:ribosomal protein S18 acetylase RimI-like enzyme